MIGHLLRWQCYFVVFSQTKIYCPFLDRGRIPCSGLYCCWIILGAILAWWTWSFSSQTSKYSLWQCGCYLPLCQSSFPFPYETHFYWFSLCMRQSWARCTNCLLYYDQLADALAKPLSRTHFERFRAKIGVSDKGSILQVHDKQLRPFS